MLRIDIDDIEVEAAIEERCRLLRLKPELVLISAAAESLGLPTVAHRYTNLLAQSRRDDLVKAAFA